jgi:hypothetical protein
MLATPRPSTSSQQRQPADRRIGNPPVGLRSGGHLSPTHSVIPVLLALVLTVAFVIVCLWWYYRPTLEAGSGSISIDIP